MIDLHRYVILMAVLATAAPSLAQRGGSGRGSSGDVWKYLAEKYDKDRNGRITSTEYQRGTSKFASYDRDGDGTITAEDFEGGGRRRSGGRNRGRAQRNRGNSTATDIAVTIARSADDNEDGLVTANEWSKSLASLDHDSDKIVSAEEIGDIMCAALGRRRLSTRAVGRRSWHLDTDKDGKVQLAELAAMFAKIDKDGNRSLSTSELDSAKSIRRIGPPRVGQMAPDFELPFVLTTQRNQQQQQSQQKSVRLSSFRGKKPVALIFGSYT